MSSKSDKLVERNQVMALPIVKQSVKQLISRIGLVCRSIHLEGSSSTA